MEIIRGSLDDISRPASSEQTGSRMSSVSLPHSDRLCPTTPFSLEVLTNDTADFQVIISKEDVNTKLLVNLKTTELHLPHKTILYRAKAALKKL